MKKQEDAVSPVVGVMLMLVVTIIIAAVVAAFAGGVMTSQETPSNAIIKSDDYFFKSWESVEWVQDAHGHWVETNEVQIMYDLTNVTFKHMSGDPLDLNKVKLNIECDNAIKSVDLSDYDANSDGKWTAGEIIDVWEEGYPNGYGILGQSVDCPKLIEYRVMTLSGQIISEGQFTATP